MKEEYHTKFATILHITYQRERLTYFSNRITITLHLTNKGKKINWRYIMLTQMSIELTQWTEHQKQITTWLTTLDRKTTTCYSKLVIEVCLQH
jgi:hypothetical protein